MKKQEFMEKLKASLWAMPEGDRQRSMDYYGEMIDDRMEEGLSEEEAVAAVGDLDEIVKQILTETPRPPQVVQTAASEKKHMPIWLIVLLVLGSPVWASLLIAMAAVIFAALVSLWSVVIALYATAFALAVSAIGLLIAAFSLLWIRHFANGTVLVGGALVCAGLAILFFLLSNLAAKGLVALTRLIWNGVTGIFKRKERTA